ncbi:MAG TPA: TCR/Tet family MFS transporter [Myxococcota bacterium]|nr:TCR/Tet family MFS transporter [Myxococcota bacterium]
MSEPRRATTAFILVTVMLDMVALGVVIPVLPSLIVEFNAGSLTDAAWWGGLFGTVFAGIQFFFAPVLGALSDRFGRRPVILLSSLGLALDYVLIALAPNLWWMLAGRAIAGFCAASISVPSAYIADVTAPEKRAEAFGMLGAAFGVGFILGPLIGGQAGAVDPRLPFWIAGGLTLANFCYGLFVLPESLPRERRARFEWAKANPVGSALLIRRYPAIWALIALSVLSYLAHDSLPHTFVFYAKARFAWGAEMVGWGLVAVGAASVVVQALAIGPIVRVLGEQRALFFGIAMGLAAFVLYGFAWAPWVVFLAIAIGAFWGVWSAAAQSMLSTTVDPSEQGRLQGALAGVRAACEVLTPAIFNGAFALGVGIDTRWAGAPMLVSALLLALGIPFALQATRNGARSASPASA